MNIDFLFKDFFTTLFHTKLSDSSDVKGVYIISSGDILINLNAEQWKDISEGLLIQEISKTIVHETIHHVLSDMKVSSFPFEETVCEIMSGQK